MASSEVSNKISLHPIVKALCVPKLFDDDTQTFLTNILREHYLIDLKGYGRTSFYLRNLNIEGSENFIFLTKRDDITKILTPFYPGYILREKKTTLFEFTKLLEKHDIIINPNLNPKLSPKKNDDFLEKIINNYFENNSHLNDYAKNNIRKNLQLDFFNELVDEKETIQHLLTEIEIYKNKRKDLIPVILNYENKLNEFKRFIHKHILYFYYLIPLILKLKEFNKELNLLQTKTTIENDIYTFKATNFNKILFTFNETYEEEINTLTGIVPIERWHTDKDKDVQCQESRQFAILLTNHPHTDLTNLSEDKLSNSDRDPTLKCKKENIHSASYWDSKVVHRKPRYDQNKYKILRGICAIQFDFDPGSAWCYDSQKHFKLEEQALEKVFGNITFPKIVKPNQNDKSAIGGWYYIGSSKPPVGGSGSGSGSKRYEKCTVKELQERCIKRKISYRGKRKDELIAALRKK
jgi:hypothetical protein